MPVGFLSWLGGRSVHTARPLRKPGKQKRRAANKRARVARRRSR